MFKKYKFKKHYNITHNYYRLIYIPINHKIPTNPKTL